MNTLLALRASRKPASLTVTLPDLESVPDRQRGRKVVLGGLQWLLGKGDRNPKMLKSETGGVYRGWGLSLAPARSSGYQMCASASAGCRTACLNNQGRAAVFSNIKAGRIARTLAWMEHRDWFEARLRWELHRISRRAETASWSPVIRLNVMSDVQWEKVTPWVFEEHPGIQFYDYTKHYGRMGRFCDGELPRNYHLTFSRSETNHVEAIDILRRGGTVTAVFRTKQLPLGWCGFSVLNGDETDLRFLDEPGCWVGLYAKGTATRDESGFVVDHLNRIALN